MAFVELDQKISSEVPLPSTSLHSDGITSSITNSRDIRWPHHVFECVRENSISFFDGMLVAHGGRSGRMSRAMHQFNGRRSGRGGQRQAGVPKIVKAKVGTTHRNTRTFP